LNAIEEQLAEILARYKKERSNLVPLLQGMQARFGYLSREAMLEIARFLQIPGSAVYGVATFYNQFRFTPLGKHPIKVCLGTACHMQGGRLVSEALQRELDIEVGGITPGGEFSLERVACIGCCVMAPVMVIGETIYPRMTPLKVEETLIQFKGQNSKFKVECKIQI
jgi:NADH-quinone oxidoreductase subunit E